MLNRLRSIWTIPDLRNKILFTIAMLLVFRLVAYVPVPGIDPSALSNANSQNSGDLKQFFGLLDVFTGGSLYTFGIASMGVYPYITASIVIQLLQGIVPKLGAMNREGEAGRNKLAQITRYITVPLALLQAFGQMALLVQLGAIQPSQFNLFNGASFIPTLSALVSLTAGTMFLVWIGELITENGIGNGISLIIFANIMVRIPQQIGSQLISNSNGAGGRLSTGGAIGILFIVALGLAMTFVMVMVYLAQRRIPVQYPSKRRVFAMERSGQDTTYIPMMVNSAGMIPIIFASSMLLLPEVIANFMQTSTNSGLHNFFTGLRTWLDSTNWYYWVIFGVMVALFTFFYATVLWEQQDLANTLQKQGAFIPGIRPGPRTNEYLTRVLHRLTFGGAIFLGIVAVAPALITTNQNNLPFQAATLLIIVGVALDTIKQLEAQMVMRNYSGFLG